MSEPALSRDSSSQRRPAPDGFERFYHERLAQTVRQVALMVGSVSLAEDITHDAMFEVLKRWEGLTNPGGYLHRCATNGAFTALRKRKRDGPAPGEFPVAAPAIEFIEMADLLSRLTDRQRVAVVLRYYADLTEAQIAEAMHCRPGTVGPLLTRAHAALRKELEP